MVGTVAEGSLRPYAGEHAHAVLFGLIAMILDQFDRRPVPQAIGEVEWRAARADLERSLNDLARARLQAPETLARDHSSFYLAIMPLHPKLGADDFAALTQPAQALAVAHPGGVRAAREPPGAGRRAGRPHAEG